MTSPASRLGPHDSPPSEDKAQSALKLMREALVALDASEAPDAIGAMLDQAACRLEDWIGEHSQ